MSHPDPDMIAGTGKYGGKRRNSNVKKGMGWVEAGAEGDA